MNGNTRRIIRRTTPGGLRRAPRLPLGTGRDPTRCRLSTRENKDARQQKKRLDDCQEAPECPLLVANLEVARDREVQQLTVEPWETASLAFDSRTRSESDQAAFAAAI